MKQTIKEFCEAYKAKKFMNTAQGVQERIEWIKKELNVKEYLPFTTKREIAEMVVEQNIEAVDGIKKYKSIDAYIGFIMASIVAHTDLECGSDPIADYDLLAESGLLPQIVTMFQASHNEIDILLKMALASELEDNNTNVLIGHFLDAILNKVEGLSGMINGVVGGLDVKEMFNDENLAKIIGFLNK
jgi:hypothetical protein